MTEIHLRLFSFGTYSRLDIVTEVATLRSCVENCPTKTQVKIITEDLEKAQQAEKQELGRKT